MNIFKFRKVRIAINKMVEHTDLNEFQKRRLRTLIRWTKKGREAAQKEFDKAVAKMDSETCVACGLNPTGDVSAIDWENFDWEGAKEFWVAVIKAVAEILKAFI